MHPESPPYLDLEGYPVLTLKAWLPAGIVYQTLAGNVAEGEVNRSAKDDRHRSTPCSKDFFAVDVE